MPFPHEKHSDDLKTAVGEAITGGMSAPAVVRALAEGTFHDFGVYELPVPTARYYAQRQRKLEAAAGLTVRASGDLDEAITQMAREILSELDQELTKVRKAKARDLEKLGTITKGLKDLRGLIVANKPAGHTFKQPAKVRDAFATQIEAAAKPQTTRATPSKPKQESTHDRPAATHREDVETPSNNTNEIEVLSPAVPAWPLHGRSNVVT